MGFQPVLIIFIRGKVIKRLVGADIVIGLIPMLQLMVVILQAEGDILDLIELLPMGPVRPFHISLELRGSRRGLKELDAPLLAGLLEVLLELRATINLDGPDREGKLALEILQDQGGREAGRPSISAGDIPARDQIPGRELPAPIFTLQSDLEGIQLDQIARRVHPIARRLADSIARLPAALPGRPGQPDVQRLDQDAARLEPR
jgi:hypothetical protein